MAWIMHPALGKTTVADFLDRKNEAADWFDKYRNKKLSLKKVISS